MAETTSVHRSTPMPSDIELRPVASRPAQVSAEETHASKRNSLEAEIKLDGANATSTPASPERGSFVIEEEQGRLASNLPPVDGGRGAWSYLVAATVLEMLVWGLPSAYGVFLPVYTDVWPQSAGLLPSVGTVATGIMYLMLPPVAWYLAKRPWLRQRSMWLGIAVATLSLLGAAFAREAWQLLLSQGVGFAIGGILLYCPVTAYMFEWWQKRRGLAIGIMYSGTGVGGLTVPFIASGLLQAYGRRTALLSFGIGYAVLLTLTIPFIRPRIAVARTGGAAQTGVAPIRWGFLRTRAFWTLFLGVLLQALGGFVPPTFLPSFAKSLNLNSTAGTLSIALINLARVPGQVLLGHLSDRVGPRKLILIMGCISSMSVYLLWGLAASEPVLLVFSLCFGAFAGSYTALFPRFIAICADNDPHLPQILYAFFSFARGIGNISAGPVATRLLELPGFSRVGGGYGVGSYGLLIVWTGAMLLGSGVGAGYKGLKRD